MEGELWQDQRRFTLHQFRNLGFGKRSHEAFVHEESRELLQEIREANGSISLIVSVLKARIEKRKEGEQSSYCDEAFLVRSVHE